MIYDISSFFQAEFLHRSISLSSPLSSDTPACLLVFAAHACVILFILVICRSFFLRPPFIIFARFD